MKPELANRTLTKFYLYTYRYTLPGPEHLEAFGNDAHSDDYLQSRCAIGKKGSLHSAMDKEKMELSKVMHVC